MSDQYEVRYIKVDGIRTWFVEGPRFKSGPLPAEGWALCLRDKMNAESLTASAVAQEAARWREAFAPVIDRLVKDIHPNYGMSGSGEEMYIDNTKPERDHFQGNIVWIADIHELATAYDALRSSSSDWLAAHDAEVLRPWREAINRIAIGTRFHSKMNKKEINAICGAILAAASATEVRN